VNYAARYLRALVLLCLCLTLLAGGLAAQTRKEEPQTGVDESKNGLRQFFAPEKAPVSAKGAVLMDGDTGFVLLESNRDLRLHPASFVKLLTLYIVFDNIRQGKAKLSDETVVSERAWKTGGSQMFVQVNTRVTLEELIKGIAVVSANDACIAVAEHLYGSAENFAAAMNVMAQKLGMKNSNFTNPHGLPDPQQYTTPYDIALLARRYLQEFPEALRYHSILEYTYNGITQRNRNPLLRKDETIDGLKTGYIAEAGYHLLATAKKDGRRSIAVVMGAANPATREKEARALLNYGYQKFTVQSLYAKGEVLGNIPVWKGASNTLPIVAVENGSVTLPTGYKGKIHEDRILPANIVAPIYQGQEIGRSVIKLDADIIKSVQLVANTGIPKAGFMKSLWHSAYLVGASNLVIFGLFVIAGVLVAFFGAFVFKNKRSRRTSALRV
jgi:serine-type D-Ala-D-Ala carboxypeptidase (penicillin-binding protein 5/6)